MLTRAIPAQSHSRTYRQNVLESRLEEVTELLLCDELEDGRLVRVSARDVAEEVHSSDGGGRARTGGKAWECRVCNAVTKHPVTAYVIA